MTQAMTAPRRGPAPALTRAPVRYGTDADFSPGQLRHLAAGTAPTATISAAVTQAAQHGRIWQLPCPDAATQAVLTAADRAGDERVTPADEATLHAFETAPALQPPVDIGTAALTPMAGDAWLLTALRWLTIARGAGDLRYLNAACKVLGAVWHRCATATEGTPWHEPRRRHLLAQVAAGVATLGDDLVRDRASRPSIHAGAPARTLPPPGRQRPDHAVRIVVLAAAGSHSADRFLTAARARDIPIAGCCWYAPPTRTRSASHYDDAWYPDTGPPAAATTNGVHRPEGRLNAEPAVRHWTAVAAQLARLMPDVIVLIGMPIVPEPILQLARLGVINAHNGDLPAYRGMDAVGWALLNGDAITCTVHHAVPRVDTGAVFATIPVARSPLPTLRQRVKAAQLHLLLDVADYAAATGDLPTAEPQPATGDRLHNRLHPHLKRLLDQLWSSTPTPAPTAPTPRR
jgi:folate-dependent phosphoribosylglycinamide formyltransferase PurN